MQVTNTGLSKHSRAYPKEVIEALLTQRAGDFDPATLPGLLAKAGLSEPKAAAKQQLANNGQRAGL